MTNLEYVKCATLIGPCSNVSGAVECGAKDKVSAGGRPIRRAPIRVSVKRLVTLEAGQWRRLHADAYQSSMGFTSSPARAAVRADPAKEKVDGGAAIDLCSWCASGEVEDSI